MALVPAFAMWLSAPVLAQAELAKLLPSNGMPGDLFGYHVVLDGNTAVIAAPDQDAADDSFIETEPGAAYVFGFDTTTRTWEQRRQLLPPGVQVGDHFAQRYALGISGDTILVGAMADYPSPSLQSVVYVFERHFGGINNWGQVALLEPPSSINDKFGHALAISGGTAVIGAPLEDSARGKVYVYERNAGGAGAWGLVAQVVAADADPTDLLGVYLAIDGDTLVVGANNDDEGGANAGAAYVFDRNHGGGNAWGQVAKLIPADTAPYDGFGWRVALSADVVLVSSVWNDDACPGDPTCDSGSVYVFERDVGGSDAWGQTAKLVAEDAAAVDDFGRGLGIDGDNVVIGARLDDDSGGNSGSVYVFERHANGANQWGQVAKILASDGYAGAAFGTALAVDADHLLISAHRRDDACLEPVDPNCDSGAVYAYSLSSVSTVAKLQSLVADVFSLNINHGIENSLDAKLGAAIQAIDDARVANDQAAVGSLLAFISAVNAQRGHGIPTGVADMLIADAESILAGLQAP